MSVRRLFILACYFCMVATGSVRAADFQQDTLEFLRQMGYRDYPAMIQERLSSAEGQALPRVNQEVLRTNAKRFAIFPLAADLASDILGRTLAESASPDRMAVLTELIARALALQPVAVPDLYPDILRDLPNSKQRAEARVAYLSNAVAESVNRQSEQLLSDILAAVYGRDRVVAMMSTEPGQAELASWRERTLKYVEKINFDPDIGQTRYLGQALALGFARFARTQNRPDLESQLAARCVEYGEVLYNFISDRLVLVNSEGEAKTVILHDGDFVMENSGPAGASTPAAIKPGSWWGWWNQKDLVGSLPMALVVGDPGALEVKAREGGSLGFWGSFRYWLSQRQMMIKGSTHGGAAHLYTDPSTGLSRIEILDNYPHGWLTKEESRGGIRIIGPEQFASDGPYMVFSSVHYDPTKFLRQIQHQFQDQKAFASPWWRSEIWELDANDELVKKDGVYEWRSGADEAFRQRVLQTPESQAVPLIQELAARAMDQMLKFAYWDGLAFGGAGEINARGFGYCTFTVAAAWQISSRVDIQTTPDQWRFVPWTVAKLGYAPGVDIQDRIYAPNGPAWDPMQASHDRVVYLRRGPWEREQRRAGILDADLDSAIRASVRSLILPQRIQPDEDTGKFQDWMRGIVELVGVSRDSRPGGSDMQAIRLGPQGGSVKDATDSGPWLDILPQAPALIRGDWLQDGVLVESYLKLFDTPASPVEHLAAEVAANLMHRKLTHEQLALSAEVIVRLLTLRPRPPPNTLPTRFRTTVEISARDAAIESYLSQITEEQIDSQTRQIVADFMVWFYAGNLTTTKLESEARRFFAVLSPFVRQLYLSSTAKDQFPNALGAAILKVLFSSTLDDHKELLAEVDHRLRWRGLSQFTFLKRTRTNALVPIENPDLSPLYVDELHGPYGVYFELQPEVKRALENVLPAPVAMTFTASQKRALRQRALEDFLVPLYRQLGVAHPALDSSELTAAVSASGVDVLRPPPKPDDCAALIARP